jgi:hypothetical protein
LRRNSEQADQWQRSTRVLTEHGQVTDRYTKAIAQLGDENLDVRIGGIYALERLARDSRRDHPTVMEVLTAYIRDRSHKRGPPSDPAAAKPDRSTQPDVEAALTVVGRRDATRDIRSIDLTGAILHGAHLARMHPARMHSARVDLARADLTGADLTGAHLTGADLTGADLTGAHLAGADLDGAKWPDDAEVPEGWRLSTGRLERAVTGSSPTK